VLSVRPVYANACAWTGATNTTWATASNWSGCGGVAPQATDTVTIPDVTNDPALGANTTIASLTINSGGVVNGGSFRLIVQGNVVVDGTFSGTTGRLAMDATGTTLGGSGTIMFTDTGRLDLTVNATAISILSSANLTVDGRIDVKAGVTVTNNGVVTITDTVSGITGNNATTSIWINAANSTLNIDGPLLATGTLTASAVGNTVNYSGAVQTVKVTTRLLQYINNPSPTTRYNGPSNHGNIRVQCQHCSVEAVAEKGKTEKHSQYRLRDLGFLSAETFVAAGF